LRTPAKYQDILVVWRVFDRAQGEPASKSALLERVISVPIERRSVPAGAGKSRSRVRRALTGHARGVPWIARTTTQPAADAGGSQQALDLME
jgi:hypothetical protein